MFPQSSRFSDWGFEALERIQADLLLPENALYGEDARLGRRPTRVAFNWGVGVMIQAVAAAARATAGYGPQLMAYVEATRRYWNPALPVAGYDVLTVPKKPDRFYDDNEWMVLGLVEASEVFGSGRATTDSSTVDDRMSAKFLAYAEEAFAFVMSGEDDKLGGGIYWRELRKDSKNTCSNAPAAAAALALYRKTGKVTYLKTAKRLYAWTREHLRDPVDGLYWDSESLKGHVDTAKWTYNSGLMLRDAAELYSITKKESYAADAKEIQSASLKRWVHPNGSLGDEGKFTFLLTENWLRAWRLVPGTEDPRPAVARGLNFLHEHSRDPHGHYGATWSETPPSGGYPTFALIDQAAAARAYFVAGRYAKKQSDLQGLTEKRAPFKPAICGSGPGLKHSLSRPLRRAPSRPNRPPRRLP